MRTDELFAHAIAIEHEAALRYAELGERLVDFGETSVGALFQRLAEEDGCRERELRARIAPFPLPNVPAAEHAWLDAGAPQPAAHELVLRLLDARGALLVARDAEQRALRFFEHAAADARDPACALLAARLAEDERRHLQRLRDVLARTPDPAIDWNALLG